VSKPPSLWKTFLVFLAPLMLSNALQSLFGTVSNVFLGQMLGVGALAAVAVFFPVMFFLFAFVMGLSTGATVLIGQAWGAGNRDKVKAIAGTTLAIAMILATTVALFGGVFSRQLMMALATPPDILDQASGYARVMLLTMPLGFVFLLTTAMMRGVGDTLTPLMALALSTAGGLILTPLLVRGWFGLPAVGVTGPAGRAPHGGPRSRCHRLRGGRGSRAGRSRGRDGPGSNPCPGRGEGRRRVAAVVPR